MTDLMDLPDASALSTASADRSVESLLDEAKVMLVRTVEMDGPRRRAARRAALSAVDDALAALRDEEDASARAAADEGRIGFLSTVCHDLKDPLAAVLMGSTFLLREGRMEDAARSVRMAQAINRAGVRMGLLLQNLTDFVHLTTGRRRMELVETPLDPLIERALDKAREAALAADVTLRYRPAESNLVVRADGEALSLALGHLLQNALRYSPPTSAVEIATAVASPCVSVQVIDQGPGVPLARLPHLFDPYWNARQRARDGVGLGLGIVTAVAKAHGAPPAVKTGATGTSITLRLPLSSPPCPVTCSSGR